jgi:heme oxygenase (biliverdin-IX-beta and delta-forming)
VTLERLRTETRDLHRRIESAVDIEAAAGDLHAYRGLLARTLGYYRPVEQMLAAFDWHTVGIDFAARRKAPMLVADLQALGVSAARLRELAWCAAIPSPASLAGALGVMYVLEGATLGGQVIVRMLSEKHGLSPTTGAAFHHGYGPANGARWRQFKEAAEGHLTATALHDEAVRCARATFRTFESWLRAG